MLGYLLIVISSLVSGVGNVFQKQWQVKTCGNENAPYIFLMFNCIFACFIFFAMSGFDVSANAVTLVYSAFYGLIACLSILLNFATMSRMNLIVCSVFSKGTSAAVWLVGILFFKERVSMTGVISAIMMLASVSIPFLKIKSGEIDAKGVFAGLAVVAIGTLSTITLKLYSAEPLKRPDSVMCFYTNVFILMFLAARFCLMKEKQKIISDFKLVKKRIYYIPFSTFGNNLSSLVSMYAVKIMPLTLYTVVGQPIGCVILFIQSKIIFKERCDKADIASLVLSVAAVLITLI